MPPDATTCSKCHDRRHYRTAKGWARCDCFWDALAASGFIQAPLRASTDGLLPSAYHHISCWPLTDVTVEGGSFDDFRFTAWRSLLELYDAGISYLTLDGTRAVDIYFGRDPDPDYPTLQALVDWQLVILILGVSDVPTNPYYPHATWRALQVRKFAGKPTWVYARYGLPHPVEQPARPQTIRIAGAPAAATAATVALPAPQPTAVLPAPTVVAEEPQKGHGGLLDAAARYFTKRGTT